MPTPTMVKPDPVGYNVFSPTYAQALGQSTGNAGGDVLRHLALINAVQNEKGAYGLAVQQANEATLKAQQADNEIEARKLLANNWANVANTGTLDMFLASQMSPEQYGFMQTRAQDADMLRLDTLAAEAFAKRGAGVKDFTSSGYGFTPQTVGTMTAGPLATEAPTIIPNYFTPSAAADMKRADASMKSADASMVSAKKADTDKQTWEVEYDPQGRVISRKQRGKGSVPMTQSSAPPKTVGGTYVVDSTGKVVLKK